MLRHVAVFNWKDGRRPDLAAVERQLVSLVDSIDGASDLACGKALGLSGATSYDFGLSIDFVDADTYQRYRSDEAHQRLLADVLLPAASDVAAVQFELRSH